MGSQVTSRSRSGWTSSTTHLAVTQHHGQIGSTQKLISTFPTRPVLSTAGSAQRKVDLFGLYEL